MAELDPSAVRARWTARCRASGLAAVRVLLRGPAAAVLGLAGAINRLLLLGRRRRGRRGPGRRCSRWWRSRRRCDRRRRGGPAGARTGARAGPGPCLSKTRYGGSGKESRCGGSNRERVHLHGAFQLRGVPSDGGNASPFDSVPLGVAWDDLVPGSKGEHVRWWRGGQRGSEEFGSGWGLQHPQTGRAPLGRLKEGRAFATRSEETDISS
jgi:hypothetical protein